MKFYLVEAVDPEERNLRLAKLRKFAHRQRMAGREARMAATGGRGGAVMSGTPQASAMVAQYTHWTKGQRARAIVQKYTGKDNNADSLDWSGGGRKRRPAPVSNKKLAVKVLRTHSYGKAAEAGRMSKATYRKKASGAANRYARTLRIRKASKQ